MTDRPINIALTFDAEMDAFDTSIASPDALEWRGIEQGIPVIDQILGEHRDSQGEPVRATWFVRCDDQIKSMTGNQAYLLDSYREIWLDHQRRGDEIAFHPHLYKEEAGQWKQDTCPETLREQIFRSLEAMKRAGFDTQVARIGEAFSSNAVMSALEEAGIRCDSTAMPGRSRDDNDRSFDWMRTPTDVYRPSYDDYRVAGDSERSLVEVPMTMLVTHADYDNSPRMRYLDLSFHPRALHGGIPSVVANTDTVVTVTHPSAVIPAKESHGLLSFSADAFSENLDFLVKECQNQGRPIRFVSLHDVAYENA